MSGKRSNCIILLVDPPAPEKTDPALRTSFGAERAAHINQDLLLNAYRLAKNFSEAMLMLSYEKTGRHPDLTWLDADDPGFLEAKGRSPAERIADAFHLAFNTGARKALLLSHLSPAVRPDWLQLAFDAMSDRTVALGLNQDGTFYLIGAAHNNAKALEGLSFVSSAAAADFAERARRAKLSVFAAPETYAVSDEETLRKWVEAKDDSPALFTGREAKKNGRHGGKTHPAGG